MLLAEQEEFMLPLSLSANGDIVTVIRVGGNAEGKKHLEDLGFVAGSRVTVISSHQGNIIVNIKDSRLAITSQMAEKIMVQPT